MTVIRPDQILTVLAFLGLLGGLWLWVRMNRGGLMRRVAGTSRLRVAEVAALSATDRAMILAVDGREFLILQVKGAPVVMTDLGPAATEVAA